MRTFLALTLVAGLVACSDAPTAPTAADDLPGSTLVAVGPAAANSSSNTGPDFTPGDFRRNAVYADGELFHTIILGPLAVTEQTRHSFDLLYRVAGQQSVGEAAPGPGYNGGRWIQVQTTWLVPEGERPLLTSAAAVLQAEADGLLTIGAENWDTAFLCPLIPSRGAGGR
jgi:hypothetical protein